MVRAIVFDLDGTLVDSLEDIARALEEALVDHGLPPATRAQVRGWIGGGARNLVEQAVDPSRVDAVLARFRVHYAAAPVTHTRLYPGFAPVLDRLTRAGLQLAVLTNKPHELSVRICAELLAPWPFVAIAGAREGIPLKPDPTAALAIARQLGLEAAACALVGDAATDLACAHAAGMRAVAVTWGFRPRAELEAARPSLLVETPAELDALLT